MMKIIAHIHTDFTTKFGIPRQSGLVESLKGKIIFEPPYRNIEALRGLDGFSHIWLIWEFSETKRDGWSPLVRPPRLGGNKKQGVFATRSPFRPNPIGLSSVRLERIEWQTLQGPVLHVLGADLMNGTPIFDIKPYITYADSHPAAVSGFTEPIEEHKLQVVLPEALLPDIPQALHTPLEEILANDPRPSYQDDPERVYGITYAGMNIRFMVNEQKLTVIEVIRS